MRPGDDFVMINSVVDCVFIVCLERLLCLVFSCSCGGVGSLGWCAVVSLGWLLLSVL